MHQVLTWASALLIAVFFLFRLVSVWRAALYGRKAILPLDREQMAVHVGLAYAVYLVLVAAIVYLCLSNGVRTCLGI